MLQSIKRAAKRVPVIGPVLRKAYISLVLGEGRERTIKRGPLTGARYYHYRWSTPLLDLVETNWGDEMPAAFVKEIAGKKRFFDVGANWGFYALLANKHRDPGCEIVCFEPHPQSAKELGTQIQLNQIKNAVVVQAAASNQVGTIEFADTGSAIGQKLASVNDSHEAARNITVPTLTLDTAMRQYGVPDLIKLDVEGAEILVLEGASELMTRHRPTLLVEVHGEEKSGPFYDILEKYNYRCERLSGVPITGREYEHHVICRPA